MNWDEIRRWRSGKRTELWACRLAVHPARRRRAAAAMAELVRDLIVDSTPPGAVIGGYWPIRGEPNLVPLLRELIWMGYRAALPVVVKRNSPVEFWQWTNGMPMKRGLWDIPVPATRTPVIPDVLVVPLVGFDGESFRLGNGGGYYDRTLAAYNGKPFCIGVGYSFSGVDTIYPQPHDIPMDAIVTEDGTYLRAPQSVENNAASDTKGPYASPACVMADVDPTYFGFLSTSECLTLVHLLLDKVRSAAGVAMEIALFSRRVLATGTYLDLAYGDIHAATLLRGAANRLTAEAGTMVDAATDSEHAANPHMSTDADLYRLHETLAETVRTALPKISDPRLYKELTKVLRLQERALAALSEPRNAQDGDPIQVRNAV